MRGEKIFLIYRQPTGNILTLMAGIVKQNPLEVNFSRHVMEWWAIVERGQKSNHKQSDATFQTVSIEDFYKNPTTTI